MKVEKMTEDFFMKAEEIGRKYWNLNEKMKDFRNEMVRVKEIRDTIRKLEANLQKFGEGSIMRSRIQEQIEMLKEQNIKIGRIDEEFEATKRELLELTAASFEIDPKGERKLDKSYIQAINHLLLGDPKDKMEFHECIITPEGVDVIDDEIRAIMVCANICDFIREAAKKRLGKEAKLRELWDRISSSKKMFKVFSVLAEKGNVMKAKEISTLIGDPAWNTRKVKNDLNNLLLDHLFTHKLIMRVERGKYKVSDIGRFLWQEFGPTKQRETSAGPQIALNKWTKCTS